MKAGVYLSSQQNPSTALMTKNSFVACGGILYYFHSCNCRSMTLLWYQNVHLKAVKFGIKKRNRVVGCTGYFLIQCFCY